MWNVDVHNSQECLRVDLLIIIKRKRDDHATQICDIVTNYLKLSIGHIMIVYVAECM